MDGYAGRKGLGTLSVLNGLEVGNDTAVSFCELRNESPSIVHAKRAGWKKRRCDPTRSALDLGWCTVSGSGFALYCDDSGATCVARDCTIKGTVTPNVKIINDPD